jgi:hypothetical protein
MRRNARDAPKADPLPAAARLPRSTPFRPSFDATNIGARRWEADLQLPPGNNPKLPLVPVTWKTDFGQESALSGSIYRRLRAAAEFLLHTQKKPSVSRARRGVPNRIAKAARARTAETSPSRSGGSPRQRAREWRTT